MAKALSILSGLVAMGLGVWGTVAWWPQVVAFLEATVAILAILVGLTVVVFGLSELKAPTPVPRDEPVAAPPQRQGQG